MNKEEVELPEIFTLPVKVCISSVELPNIVEPLSNTIEELTNSVLICSCGYHFSITVISPPIVNDIGSKC